MADTPYQPPYIWDLGVPFIWRGQTDFDGALTMNEGSSGVGFGIKDYLGSIIIACSFAFSRGDGFHQTPRQCLK